MNRILFKVFMVRLIIPSLYCISAFGPYLGLGLRVEHVVIYMTFFVLLLGIVFLYRIEKSKNVFLSPTSPLLLIHILVLIWITINSIIFGVKDNVELTKVVSHFENFMQPIIIIFTLTFLYYKKNLHFVDRVLRITWTVLFILLMINTSLIILNFFVNVPEFLYKYSTNSLFLDSNKPSIMQLSASNNRYTGIFSHPADCGGTYAIALIGWIYLYKFNKYNFLFYLFLIPIFIGGVLSISKIFLFLGIFFSAAYFIAIERTKLIFNPYIIINLIGLFLVFLLIFNYWEGYEYVSRYFDISSNDDLLALITGGRYAFSSNYVANLGERGMTNSEYFYWVWSESFFIGFGFAPFTPFDSGYLEYFSQGGLIALILKIILLLIIFFYGSTLYKFSKNDSLFFITMFFLLVFTHFGYCLFTANRVSTFLWTLMSLHIIVAFKKKNNYSKTPILQNR